jgi:hypothetical protein
MVSKHQQELDRAINSARIGMIFGAGFGLLMMALAGIAAYILARGAVGLVG